MRDSSSGSGLLCRTSQPVIVEEDLETLLKRSGTEVYTKIRFGSLRRSKQIFRRKNAHKDDDVRQFGKSDSSPPFLLPNIEALNNENVALQMYIGGGKSNEFEVEGRIPMREGKSIKPSGQSKAYRDPRWHERSECERIRRPSDSDSMVSTTTGVGVSTVYSHSDETPILGDSCNKTKSDSKEALWPIEPDDLVYDPPVERWWFWSLLSNVCSCCGRGSPPQR